MAKKQASIYTFIDAQNLHMGVKSEGWQIDYRKFRQYLRNKYGVVRAYMFIGYRMGNEDMYRAMQEYGFILIFKPTLELSDGTVKGDVDAELVLHTMIMFNDFSKAIIVSGDGDFYCLLEYLEAQAKLLRLLTPNRHYSGLLRRFNKYVVRVDRLQESLRYKKTRISVRSKP